MSYFLSYSAPNSSYCDVKSAYRIFCPSMNSIPALQTPMLVLPIDNYRKEWATEIGEAKLPFYLFPSLRWIVKAQTVHLRLFYNIIIIVHYYYNS